MTLADPAESRRKSNLSASSPPIALAASALLEQCATFVSQFSAATPAYTKESSTFKGGTIGRHIRHTLDHFRAALDAHSRGEPVEYDHRERNVPMEHDPQAARAAIETIQIQIAELTPKALAAPLRVRIMVSSDGSLETLESSLGRELAFATHHAVHHHAMMSAIAQEMNLQTPQGFGFAPSTINHHAPHRTNS